VGIGVAFLVVASRGGRGTEVDPSVDPYAEDPPDSGATVDVGDYATELPDGWEYTATSNGSENQAVFTDGPNRVLAYAFAAGDDDVATELLPALVKRRLNGFAGTLGEPDDESGGGPQWARLLASGTLSGKRVRLIADLWLPTLGDALLTVQVLAAGEGSSIADAAQGIVDALSSGF
jgi:hypothetical protein